MSLIFEHSCLAAKPELDIFSAPPTMAALEDSWSTEYLPTTSLDDTSPIKFMISGDSNHYIDPYSSYLYLEVKITKQDGTDIDAGTQIGPVNLLAHSLFGQVDVWLNDTLITSSSNLYHYRAYLETLLSFSDESKKSQLTMSLYSKDTPGQMDDIADANTGLVARRGFTDKSKTVPLICKLHSVIFFQKRLLLNGVDMQIKLIRNSDKFVLMGANNSTHKLKITAASFFGGIDKIPNEEFTFPSCAVINTKPHTERGEHWVCFIKNRDRTGIYFDSYGYAPYNLPEVGDVLANCIDWTYNAKSLQTPFSTVCGEYCIFFLTHMAKGFPLDHIINLLDDNGDTFANDAFVYSYTIHKYRNVINTTIAV
ncbi:uncharacterized protein F54H12.2-like [Watersipora subatra]|uniref:uncharacterized protein F54H12.2-like n=1 Tax=Watersipora subatra TaxID=2589382 RepID=UPI00355ADBC2